MVREDGKRNFVHFEDGEETSVFSGTYPRQAALKAARRLHPAPSPDDIDGKATLSLRERGTDRVHIYEGWRGPRRKTTTPPSGWTTTSPGRTSRSRASNISKRKPGVRRGRWTPASVFRAVSDLRRARAPTAQSPACAASP